MKYNVELLIKSALKAKGNAYCIYSHFHVGACILSASGKMFCGCNIENASYPATLCAERTAVGNLIAGGEKPNDIVAVAIISDSNDICMPCGICRQFLSEFNPDMDIICANSSGDYKLFKLSDLLPHTFSL